MKLPRIIRTLVGLGLAAGLGTAAPALGQSGSVAAPCSRADVPAAARDFCISTAQAVSSAQPQLGILLAGGNPTLGSASTAGLRLGLSPGTGTSARLNFVPIRIPDILDRGSGPGAVETERTIPAPAASATLSLNLTPGTDLAPTIGGIGSIDLLGSVHWLPLRALGISSVRLETSEFSYGIGARLGILRESFTMPGASVSVMYRRVGELGYGSACAAPIALTQDSGAGYRFGSGACPSGGDPGEFVLDLTDLSGRGVIGKQLGRFGVAAGVGFDRFESDLALGFRAPPETVAGEAGYVARAFDLDLVNERWSAFGSASFTTLVTTFALEAGWMQGGEALNGYPETGGFDPTRGVLFGSLGVRLSF